MMRTSVADGLKDKLHLNLPAERTATLFGFIYFGMLNTGVTWIIFFAIVLSLIPHDMMYGPQATLIAEKASRAVCAIVVHRSVISSLQSSPVDLLC